MSAGKDVQHLLMYRNRNTNHYSSFEKQFFSFLKSNTSVTQLGVIPSEMRMFVPTKPCMSKQLYSSSPKTGKNPNVLSTDKKINKLWYIYIQHTRSNKDETD